MLTFCARRDRIRLEAAGAQAQRMYAERRHLRAEQLAWVCKAAMAASNARRKARAWRRWRQVQVTKKNTEVLFTNNRACVYICVFLVMPVRFRGVLLPSSQAASERA